MDSIRFGADWEGTLTLVTTLAVAGIAGSIGVVAYTAFRMPHPVLAVFVWVLGLPGLVALGLAYRWSPRAFSITEAAVVIERPGKPIAIPLASIREARELAPGTSFSRVLGSGGLFGYFGSFRNAQLGDVQLYATRRDGYVLLSTDAATYVITPSPAASFLEQLQGRLRRAR